MQKLIKLPTDLRSPFPSSSEIASVTLPLRLLDSPCFSPFITKSGSIAIGTSNPSLPDISFRLRRASLPGFQSSPLSFPEANFDISLKEEDLPAARQLAAGSSRLIYSSLSESTRNAISKAISDTISRFLREAKANNLHTAPFFVAVAARYADNSLLLLNGPVLMIPNSSAPYPAIKAIALDENALTLTVSVALLNYPCSLEIKGLPAVSDPIEYDDIRNYEVLVSDEVETFIEKQDVAGTTHLSPSPSLFSSAETELPLLQTRRIIWNYPLSSPKEIEAKVKDMARSLHSLFPQYSDNLYLPKSIIEAQPLLYNSRLFLTSPLISPQIPLPLAASIQTTDAADTPSGRKATLTVQLSTEGKRYISDSCATSLPCAALSEASDGSIYPSAWSVPRFLFYPDADATALRLSQGADKYLLPLTPCDDNRGSFWFGGFIPDLPALSSPFPAISDTDVYLPSRIMVTAPQNHSICVMTSSPVQGDIFGLVPATKSLGNSPGDFPLYAVAESGIWLLRFNGDSLEPRQLISPLSPIRPDCYSAAPDGLRMISSSGTVILKGLSITLSPIFFRESDNVEILTLPLSKIDSTRVRFELRPRIPAIIHVEQSHTLRTWKHTASLRPSASLPLLTIRHAPYTRLRIIAPASYFN